LPRGKLSRIEFKIIIKNHGSLKSIGPEVSALENMAREEMDALAAEIAILGYDVSVN